MGSSEFGENKFQSISYEVLKKQAGFQQIPGEVQADIVSRLSGIFEALHDNCGGRWNILRWDEYNNRIIRCGVFEPIAEVEESYKILRTIITSSDLSYKGGCEFTRLCLRDGLFMFQLGVKKIEDLKKSMEMYRTASSEAVFQGKRINRFRGRSGVRWVNSESS